jgi:pyruvate dehydrogenase E2 component (dihydrolipoamide acetyltransferase)
VDLDRLAAATEGRRITRADVEAAASAQGGTVTASAEGTSISQMRRVIAGRMAASAHSAAAVTLTTEADATELVRLREQLKAASGSGQPAPSYNDLLIKLAACALQLHPALNASWGDNEITVFRDVHIALAVDTEAGLVTPVIRNVPVKTVRQIAAETLRLVERALARQLTPDEMAGGTFTITNLGMYNIDAFTPIINLPQCAILGVGRIARRPAEWQGELALRYRVTLSLTFDHRVVDGAPAARFLDTIRQYVEVPWLWLIQ